MPAIFQLDGPDDFMWYKQGLNNQLHHDFVHKGTPDRYPCQVQSEYVTFHTGQYGYIHRFTYRVQQTCPDCGHTEWLWPNQVRPDVKF